MLCLQGFIGFFNHFMSLSLLQACLSVYTFFFGFVIVMLESQGIFFPDDWKKRIKVQAKFLTMLNGRGALYVFLGTLLMAQWPDFWESIAGLYMAFLGSFMFFVGLHTKSKLDSVRSSLKNEAAARAAFKAADANGDGSLIVEELAVLCAHMGSSLGTQELESALQTLDKDGNGSVEEDEFIHWWKGGGTRVLYYYE